jgi:hypothetical protein
MNKNPIVALLGLLLLAPAAQAVPVTYDFTVNGGPDGPLAGVTSSGFFTFDDSVVPAGGGLVNQTGLFVDFGFTWNGIAYDETTANSALLAFEPSGDLYGATFGSHCSTTLCQVLPGTDSWAIGATVQFGNVFVYALAGIEQDFGVPFAVTYTPRGATSVAEPSGLALLFSGLLALGCFSRRLGTFRPS